MRTRIIPIVLKFLLFIIVVEVISIGRAALQLDGQIRIEITPLSHALVLGLSLRTVATEETREALLLHSSALPRILMHSLRTRC